MNWSLKQAAWTRVSQNKWLTQDDWQVRERPSEQLTNLLLKWVSHRCYDNWDRLQAINTIFQLTATDAIKKYIGKQESSPANKYIQTHTRTHYPHTHFHNIHTYIRTHTCICLRDCNIPPSVRLTETVFHSMSVFTCFGLRPNAPGAWKSLGPWHYMHTHV